MSDDFDDTLDDYPDELARSLEARHEWRTRIAAKSPELEFIVSDVDRWRPGSVVTVAFIGGSLELHKAIAETVATIADVCGLTIDFGCGSGGYRTWTPDDQEYSADIRVGFTGRGYWSLVGTASVDPSVGRPSHTGGGRPHQQSMNFSGFDSKLPSTWRRTVLHEFLHALAFKHEHQNMRGPCQEEFRWEDDQWYVPTTDNTGRFVADPHGRRPGIYTYLGGPPNRWNRAKVDHNLRSEGAETGVAGEFDAESVMLYRFPPLFYKNDSSPCAPVGLGTDLSAGDRRGLRLLYPDTDAEQLELTDRAKRARKHLAAGHRPPGSTGQSTDDMLEGLGADYSAATSVLLERLWA